MKSVPRLCREKLNDSVLSHDINFQRLVSEPMRGQLFLEVANHLFAFEVDQKN